LLASAKKLCTCGDDYISKTVYINADLSPTEAKATFEYCQQQSAKQVKLRNTQNTQTVTRYESHSPGDQLDDINTSDEPVNSSSFHT